MTERFNEVNLNINKSMAFEREKYDVIDLKVRAECKKHCEIRLKGEIMEKVN